MTPTLTARVVAMNPEPNDQRELAALVATADPAARRNVVARLGPRVRGIASTILGDRADAEDASQAAWVEILTSTSSYQGGNLGAWVARISGRTAMRHALQRRERAIRVDLVGDMEALPFSAPPPTLASHEIARPLLDYLADLAEPRRVVLVLRHVLDYSIEEISALTQMSVNTVKDRLLKARAQLRRAIRRDLTLARAPAHRRRMRRAQPRSTTLVGSTTK